MYWSTCSSWVRRAAGDGAVGGCAPCNLVDKEEWWKRVFSRGVSYGGAHTAVAVCAVRACPTSCYSMCNSMLNQYDMQTATRCTLWGMGGAVGCGAAVDGRRMVVWQQWRAATCTDKVVHWHGTHLCTTTYVEWAGSRRTKRRADQIPQCSGVLSITVVLSSHQCVCKPAYTMQKESQLSQIQNPHHRNTP